MRLGQLKPAVPKYWLMTIAGLLWTAVGAGLCRLSYHWAALLSRPRSHLLALAGAVLAVLAYRFIFRGLAAKNIDRLCRLPDKGCLFAFQAWRSYLIVGVMIFLGAALRHSPIPKPFLAVVYLAVGGALIGASLRYYACLWRVAVKKEPCRSK